VNRLLVNISKEKNVHSLALQLSSSLIGFVTFMLLARYLNKHDFGLWVIYITSFTFLDMLRAGLTQNAVIRYLSGAKGLEEKQLIGSNLRINLIISSSLAIIVFLAYLIFQNSLKDSGYYLFFKYFPIMIMLNYPVVNAISLLQAYMRFHIILYIRLIEGGGFLIFLVLNNSFFHFGVEQIIIAQFVLIALISLCCQTLGYDGIKNWKYASKESNQKILSFGKFSVGTLIGSNLLKSADTFIIGLSAVLGPAAVAVYSIPFKVIEVIEVPLRSFSQTLFPKLSKLSIEGKADELKKSFYAHTGALTLLIIPFLILLFIFSGEVMTLIGGSDYANSAIIFRIILIYGITMPLSRFSGVTLDSINKPEKNFIKMLFMVGANIIGDLIAVFIFHSLIGVAIVTIVFSVLGIFLGYYFLNREISLQLNQFFKQGISFYKEYSSFLISLLRKSE
jgi:O-antigen/teichoic acid export membrane protein